MRLPYLVAVLITLATPIAPAIEIEAGVVVKFGPNAGLVIRNASETTGEVVFTSLQDDSVGGQTLPQPGQPTATDWLGIRIANDAEASRISLSRSIVRHARIGIDTSRSLSLFGVQLQQNDVGVRVRGNATPLLTDSVLTGNRVGLQSELASPTVVNGSLVGNTAFGAQNLSITQPVAARANWWGAASGPNDPFDNPAGTGDPVTRGVDYGQFRSTPPLQDCAVVVRNAIQGSVNVPDLVLLLTCRGATEARVAETENFAGATFSAFTQNQERQFRLTGAEGVRTIYVQYRGAQGQLRNESKTFSFYRTGAFPIMTEPTERLRTISETLQIAATAEDPAGVPVTSVAFSINGVELGVDTTAPYTASWNTATVPNGTYVVSITALTAQGVSRTNASREFNAIIVRRPSTDFTPPVISGLSFAGQPLVDGMVINAAGVISGSVTDVGDGLDRMLVSFNDRGSREVSDEGPFSLTESFGFLFNGPLEIRFTARDRAGNVTTVSRLVTLMLGPPAAPTISSPQNGDTIRDSRSTVFGQAPLDTRVQLYVNNVPYEQPFSVSGMSFIKTVNVPADGVYVLSADASNNVGTSPRSALTSVTVEIPPPSIIISYPAKGAIVNKDIDVAAQVATNLLGTEVEFFVNGMSRGVDSSAPYSIAFPIVDEPDGLRTVRAVARNGTLTAEATSTFTVRRDPPPPAPYVPPYVGTTMTATPTTSYGTAPVVVTGRLRVTAGTAVVPNAAATIVLRSNGFERKISIVSDDSGNFSYNFVPQASDQGVYEVTAIHPEGRAFVNPTPTGVATFTLNRLTPVPSRLALAAPRGFEQIFETQIRASQGDGASGVRLLLRAEDQGGTPIPEGITLSTEPAQDIPAGGVATFRPRFNSTAATPRSGNLILAVVANESGNIARSKLRVTYELFPATPSLVARPTGIFTGVRKGQQVTEIVRLENKGLVRADDVRVVLGAAPGQGPLPPWITMVSPSAIGPLNVGAVRDIELRFAPSDSTADGTYQGKLTVSSANAPGGDISINSFVNEVGEGIAQFRVVDMFTTPEGAPSPVLGVNNARVVITNEANPAQRAEGRTDANGEVTLTNVPPGRYQYRVTGPSHTPASGRLLLRPGVPVAERVFIDYTTVTFTWSVNPITIPDRYRIVIDATFRTQVPAPIVLLQPTALNLPDMQVGEVITGEFAITNYGLLRADAVQLTAPAADEYFRLELLGSVPETLEAGERVTVPYKVTALRALPGLNLNAEADSLRAWLSNQPERRSTGGCSSYTNSTRLSYRYTCLAGDERTGAAESRVTKTYGNSCSVNGTTTIIGTGNGGGWGGGGYVPRGNYPPLPECMGDCTEGCACASAGCGGGGGGDGGNGGGAGGSPGGAGGPTPPPCNSCPCTSQN